MKKPKQKIETDNPYLNARRAWNEHVGGLMKSVQVWQTVALSSLLITLAAVGGIIVIGSQSKFIPLVFQQDASGNTLSVTRADKVAEANLEDYRHVAARFIENIRLVSVDSDLQKKAILQTYSYLNGNDAAVSKANHYFNHSAKANPFNRAGLETVNVEIRSVLQETESAWQVAWIETIRNRDGALKSEPQTMKAILTLYQNPKISDSSNEALLKNPHFIFVRDFNWSKELQPGVIP
jgi:type IV secretion system protein VirB5